MSEGLQSLKFSRDLSFSFGSQLQQLGHNNFIWGFINALHNHRETTTVIKYISVRNDKIFKFKKVVFVLQ